MAEAAALGGHRTDTGSGTPAVIRVLVCHTDALNREGMRLVLSRFDDVDVVADAASEREAADAAASRRPHVALAAAADPNLDPGRLIASVRDRVPEARVVLTSCPQDGDWICAAARAGASGFVPADAEVGAVGDAIRAVAAGGVYLPPASARTLLEQLLASQAGPPPEAARAVADLTAQELDVLTQLARGRSNVEIGRSLYLSESTVKTHLTHVFRKLGVRDRVQAVIKAYDAGLVEPAASRHADDHAAATLRPRLRIVGQDGVG